MSDPLIEVSHPKPGVQQIMLNRPDKRNALNIDLLTQLTEQLSTTKERVVILGGYGPTFSAGLDLSEAIRPELVQASADAVANALHAIYSAPAISIAMVQGSALAGGAGILAACDLVVAAEDAHIGFPETRRGLVAALVMTLLRRRICGSHISELLLLGEPVSVRRAHEMGLVHRVVETDLLEAATLALADTVLRGSPQATARTKWLIQDLEPRAFDEELDMALLAHAEARHGPEALEGIHAFLEKRPPLWPR
jgi:enoyl-CoA hydratase/carnithine racemase